MPVRIGTEVVLELVAAPSYDTCHSNAAVRSGDRRAETVALNDWTLQYPMVGIERRAADAVRGIGIRPDVCRFCDVRYPVRSP